MKTKRKPHWFKRASDQAYRAHWKLNHFPSALPSAASQPAQWPPLCSKFSSAVHPTGLEVLSSNFGLIAILEMWSGPADVWSAAQLKAQSVSMDSIDLSTEPQPGLLLFEGRQGSALALCFSYFSPKEMSHKCRAMGNCIFVIQGHAYFY